MLFSRSVHLSFLVLFLAAGAGYAEEEYPSPEVTTEISAAVDKADDLARKQTKEGYEQAVRVCTAVIQRYPNDPQAYVIRAQARMGLGELNSALQDIDRAIDLHSMLPAGRRYGLVYHRYSLSLIRAHIYIGMGEFQKAGQSYLEGLNLTGEVITDKGYPVLLMAGMHEQAYKFLSQEKHGVKDPLNPQFYLGRTKAVLDGSRPGKTDIEIEKLFFSLENCGENNWDCEVEKYTRIIELEPSAAWRTAYLSQRALRFGLLEQYDRAIKDYTKVIETTTDKGLRRDAFLGRGAAYFYKSDAAGQKFYDKTLADISKVLKLDPDYPFAFFHRAKVYDRQMNCNQAVEDMKTYLKLEDSEHVVKAAKKTLSDSFSNCRESIQPLFKSAGTE